MERDEILPVLYDLVVTIGREHGVKSLLQHTVQRLLYHTSFSAGFACLDVPACPAGQEQVEIMLDAVVGDFDLIEHVGKPLTMPAALICSEEAAPE